jgi:hypothetical protein
VLVYIDNIVVYSQSWDDHLGHLDRVLGAIASAGITLSPAKCHIGYYSILLLGQKVSCLGLSMHREKVQAIIELAAPNSTLNLQKFLGMVVYFSTYVPFYSFIAAPLFNLLKKGCKWIWHTEHDIAFRQLKEALASTPVLDHPSPGHLYHLYTDTSDYATDGRLERHPCP